MCWRRRVSACLGFAAVCFPCHGHCSHGEVQGIASCTLPWVHLLFLFKGQMAFKERIPWGFCSSLGLLGCVFDERTLMRAGDFLTPYRALLRAAEVNSKLLAEVELKKVSDVTGQRGEEKTSCSADCYDAHDLVLAFLKGGLVWASWQHENFPVGTTNCASGCNLRTLWKERPPL